MWGTDSAMRGQASSLEVAREQRFFSTSSATAWSASAFTWPPT